MIHAKKSLDSVWCGKSIFGQLTDAEGHKVNCEECKRNKLVAETTERYNQFATNVDLGIWPTDSCDECPESNEPWNLCCKRKSGSHGPMSCCPHCGSDHRNPYLWTYRGKYHGTV